MSKCFKCIQLKGTIKEKDKKIKSLLDSSEGMRKVIGQKNYIIHELADKVEKLKDHRLDVIDQQNEVL